MSTQHPVRDILSSATIPASRPVDSLRHAGTDLFVGNCIEAVVAVLAYGDRLTSGNVLYTGFLLFGLSFLFLAPQIVQPKNGLRAPVVAQTLATSESMESRLAKHGLRVPVVIQLVDGTEPFRSIITLDGMRKKHAKNPEVGALLALQQVEPGKGELAAVDEPSTHQKGLMTQFKKQPRKLKSDAPILPTRHSLLSSKPGWAGGVLASTCLLGITTALRAIFTVAAQWLGPATRG